MDFCLSNSACNDAINLFLSFESICFSFDKVDINISNSDPYPFFV